MNKLLFICGPTATGKTDLALLVHRTISPWLKLTPAAQIISADSRQVYIGMDIGTGKDKPTDGTKILGYDLIRPDEEFSVAHYYHYAWETIKRLWQKNTLPIIVGGTGQYLDSLLNPPASMSIKPDSKLRRQLNSLNVEELQVKLKQVDPQRWKKMNHSDQLNPRRLIRAIEIALSPTHYHTSKYDSEADVLRIGLKAPLLVINERINQRVLTRAEQGMDQEVQALIKKYPDWSYPAFTGTGYREWREYLEGKITQDQAITKWQQRERQYARRQLTWFKNMPQINWYDISNPNYQKQLVHQVKNWYAIQ